MPVRVSHAVRHLSDPSLRSHAASGFPRLPRARSDGVATQLATLSQLAARGVDEAIDATIVHRRSSVDPTSGVDPERPSRIAHANVAAGES